MTSTSNKAGRARSAGSGRGARRGCAAALAGLALTGLVVAPATPALADVEAGSGYGQTTVRCEAGTVRLDGITRPIDDGTVWVAVVLYQWLPGEQRWVHGVDQWRQVGAGWNTVLPVGSTGTYYYVGLHYAFGTPQGYVFRFELIHEYAFGGYNALGYCKP